MKQTIWLFVTVIFFQGFGQNLALAETKGEEHLVEINYPIDTLAPYKNRRRTHGGTFGVHTENYVPRRWESLIDQEYYEDSYGKAPILLTSLEGGYKYNFSLGSLNFMGGLGYGEAQTSYGGGSRKINIVKYYGRGMFALDNILPEPYIVPYIAGSVWKMKIKESEDISDFGGTVTSGIGFDYTFGALFQLNWLDEDFARESLSNSGIQNTFIDVFATQYLKTLNKADPSLASGLTFGLGLRLEF